MFCDPKQIDRDVGFVARRLSERMVAARMAIAFFQRSVLGEKVALPDGLSRLSVNQMAEFVLDDAEQAESSNVKTRYWLPSRPVIHISAAAAIMGQKLKKAGQSTSLESFLSDRDLIEVVVRLAAELEALIAKDPKFPVKADQLIRFRLA